MISIVFERAWLTHQPELPEVHANGLDDAHVLKVEKGRELAREPLPELVVVAQALAEKVDWYNAFASLAPGEELPRHVLRRHRTTPHVRWREHLARLEGLLRVGAPSELLHERRGCSRRRLRVLGGASIRRGVCHERRHD